MNYELENLIDRETIEVLWVPKIAMGWSCGKYAVSVGRQKKRWFGGWTACGRIGRQRT